VKLQVYDLLGRKAAILLNEEQPEENRRDLFIQAYNLKFYS
jgi:hypothetical protein